MPTTVLRFDVARPLSRFTFSRITRRCMNVLTACREVMAEAQEMRRQARRRYPRAAIPISTGDAASGSAVHPPPLRDPEYQAFSLQLPRQQNPTAGEIDACHHVCASCNSFDIWRCLC
jgi:hypothetical protein